MEILNKIMCENKKSVKELKIEFVNKSEELLLKSSKISFIKLLVEYRCDKYSDPNTEQYLGLKEMFDWSQANFSKDRILASWMFIRGLKKCKTNK